MEQVSNSLLKVKMEIVEKSVESIDKLLDVLPLNLDNRDIVVTIGVDIYRQHRLILETMSDIVSENMSMAYSIYRVISAGNSISKPDAVPYDNVEMYTERLIAIQLHTNKTIMDIINKSKESE